MTTIYGDGYEEATEPGPDVERQWSDGKWEPRFGQDRPLIKGIVYRRPIKLRVGEMYRCRNVAIVEVVDIRIGKTYFPYLSMIVTDDRGARVENGFMSYKENGAFYVLKNPWDIIEHIPKQPKEKPMNEQTITVNNIALTHDQVQEAYDKMQKAKAENEIKAEDWVVCKSDLKIVKIKEVKFNMCWFRGGASLCWLGRDLLTKIHCTPEQKAWLDSLIGGAE